MTTQIVIRGKGGHQNFGQTRSKHEKNLRKEWGSTMTDEQLDKCEWLERKRKAWDGSGKNFIPGHQVDTAEDFSGLDRDGWNMGKGDESAYALNYGKIKWDD